MPASGWDDLTTADDLLRSALRRIGVLASGETYTAQEGLDGLAVLNALIDEWRTQRLTICTQARSTYTLTANTASYTVGVGGTFNQQRPLWWDAVTYVQDDGSETPLHIFRPGEWERLDKTLTSTIPTGVRIGTNYSLTTLTFYPIPTTAVGVALYYPASHLTSIDALTSAVSVPPGGWNALRYNLALELSEEYGKPPTPLLVKRAAESLANWKRTNINMDVLRTDLASGGGDYQIETDTWVVW